jgi:Xaa-Pro aminopeptidase
MKGTLLPFEKRISDPEMARRYREVRKGMNDRSLDLLLISGNSQLSQRGHLRYMTNWTQWLFEEYALFPLKGELIYFSRYALRAELVKSFCKLNDVRFPQYGEHGLGNIPAQQLSEIIKGLNPSRIGVVGFETMSAEFYRTLSEHLPGFTLESASDILQKVRMIKSPEEIKFVRRSAQLGDHAFGIFSKSLRPGRKEFEVLTEVDTEVKKLGAEDTFYMTGSGKDPIIKFYNMAYRTYRKGDLVIFNIELAGQGGYFTQLVRTLSIGKPEKKIRSAYDICLESMNKAGQALKPGAKTSEIFYILKKTIETKFWRMDMNTGHSQGLDIFEPPLISAFDHTELRPGMIIILHPRVFISSKSSVWVGNTYLITEKGATCLNTSDPGLIVV